MSSSIVYPQGNKSVTLTANEYIAVYSKAPCQVFRRTGYPQLPTQDVLLGTVSDGQTVFGPYTTGATIIIAPGASQAMYETGLSPKVMEVSSRWAFNAAPNALNSTGTLTAAMILGGIVTSSTAAGVTATVDTGAVMDTAADFVIGDKVQWAVINTGPNTFTVTTDTNHTLIGTMTVLTNVSAVFETRKTAAATYVTYRLA